MSTSQTSPWLYPFPNGFGRHHVRYSIVPFHACHRRNTFTRVARPTPEYSCVLDRAGSIECLCESGCMLGTMRSASLSSQLRRQQDRLQLHTPTKCLPCRCHNSSIPPAPSSLPTEPMHHPWHLWQACVHIGTTCVCYHSLIRLSPVSAL